LDLLESLRVSWRFPWPLRRFITPQHMNVSASCLTLPPSLPSYSPSFPPGPFCPCVILFSQLNAF
jgi:hypothetical protein